MIIKKKKFNRENANIESIEPINTPPIEEPEEEDVGAFDLLADTAERQERRRGDRRRGYRRIEDRSLVSRAHEEAKQIKEQAAKDGFQTGIAKAEEELQELRDAISSLLGVKEEAYKHYKNDIALIAIQVA